MKFYDLSRSPRLRLNQITYAGDLVNGLSVRGISAFKPTVIVGCVYDGKFKLHDQTMHVGVFYFNRVGVPRAIHPTSEWSNSFFQHIEFSKALVVAECVEYVSVKTQIFSDVVYELTEARQAKVHRNPRAYEEDCATFAHC